MSVSSLPEVDLHASISLETRTRFAVRKDLVVPWCRYLNSQASCVRASASHLCGTLHSLASRTPTTFDRGKQNLQSRGSAKGLGLKCLLAKGCSQMVCIAEIMNRHEGSVTQVVLSSSFVPR